MLPEELERALPRVLGRRLVVRRALVAVERVGRVGIAHDVRGHPGPGRGFAEPLHAVDRDRLVEVAEEAEPRRPERGREVEEGRHLEAPLRDPAAVKGHRGAELVTAYVEVKPQGWKDRFVGDPLEWLDMITGIIKESEPDRLGANGKLALGWPLARQLGPWQGDYWKPRR